MASHANLPLTSHSFDDVVLQVCLIFMLFYLFHSISLFTIIIIIITCSYYCHFHLVKF